MNNDDLTGIAGRVSSVAAGDEDAVVAYRLYTQPEGTLPALELVKEMTSVCR